MFNKKVGHPVFYVLGGYLKQELKKSKQIKKQNKL